jgi:predicted transcriptional regulator of viral defense system
MQQMKKKNWQSKIIRLAKTNGIVRPCDMENLGIPREYLLRLCRIGILERVGRGLYAISGNLTSESRQFAEITKRIPQAVICLMSALQYHGLTTQLPHEVWIALQSHSWYPKMNYPPIRVVWMSKNSQEFGIEKHHIDNVPVKIYGVAKTIADLFKYRNKIGIDIAIEALKEARRKKQISMDDLWKAAKVCRVTKIIRPYMEAVV